MEIPFKLNIFKQIEIYQELEELDRQFQKQLKDLYKYKVLTTSYAKNPSLWFFEKKILHWVYINHKHLGSPMKISYFTSGEYLYDYIHKKDLSKIVEDVKKELPIIERNWQYMNCTSEEVKSIQIRKVFGNLEVKGFAKFFKENENNYWNINQGNCDGVFLTTKGLEYARMIYCLYEYENTDGEYKKIKGLKRVLKMKTYPMIKFNSFIYIAWGIVFGSVFLFFKILINEIISLF